MNLLLYAQNLVIAMEWRRRYMIGMNSRDDLGMYSLLCVHLSHAAVPLKHTPTFDPAAPGLGSLKLR